MIDGILNKQESFSNQAIRSVAESEDLISYGQLYSIAICTSSLQKAGILPKGKKKGK